MVRATDIEGSHTCRHIHRNRTLYRQISLHLTPRVVSSIAQSQNGAILHGQRPSENRHRVTPLQLQHRGSIPGSAKGQVEVAVAKVITGVQFHLAATVNIHLGTFRQHLRRAKTGRPPHNRKIGERRDGVLGRAGEGIDIARLSIHNHLAHLQCTLESNRSIGAIQGAKGNIISLSEPCTVRCKGLINSPSRFGRIPSEIGGGRGDERRSGEAAQKGGTK